MAITIYWYLELNCTSFHELLHRVFDEIVCERANAAYRRAKKWCSPNGHGLVHFDCITAIAHHKDNRELYTLLL